MSTKLRTAVIGCGSIAKTHSASLQKNADYAEIVAYVDVDEPRALALRDQYAPGAAVFTDWRVMLDEVKPDVVHICTPHDLHCEMACECLGRGINVYLEKPICISEEELARVEAAAAASKAKITVSFQNRRIACNRLFYHLIEEEGGAVAGRGFVTWKRGYDYYTADDWHGRRHREGGGVMINQAIHTLDFLLQAFPSPIKSVRGFTDNWENVDFTDVEDNAHFLVRFENGTGLSFSATNNYAADAPNFYEVVTKSGVRITGMDGHLYRNGVRMDTEEVIVPTVGKACWGVGHVVCIREFYEAILTDGEVPVSLASAARTMRVLFALYRSEGKHVAPSEPKN